MLINPRLIAVRAIFLASALALSGPVLAETDMAAEIAQLELRVAQLKRLKALREEEKLLTAQLAETPTAPPAAPPAAVAAVSAAPATPAAPAQTTASTEAAADKAAVASAAAQKTAEAAEAALKQKGLAANTSGTQKFGGIEFGIGTAFTLDLGNNDRIKEAEVVNNIVRVKDEENVRARIVLESHYFFTPKCWNLFGVKNGECATVDGKTIYKEGQANLGIGPFIAFQPGTDNVIEGIGAGIMVGLRRPKADSAESFNIGIGVMYDLNTRLLGEGLTRNQVLPAGDVLRYRETSQSGLLIMSSYSF